MSSKISEPVCVKWTAQGCHHCDNLSKIWPQVQEAMKKVHPNLRFVHINSPSRNGEFNEKLFPKSLKKYKKWYPMVLLVPGATWDNAMQSNNTSTPIDLVEGVVIMNGFRKDGIQYNYKYNITKPEEFAKWLKDTIEDPEFKKVQSATKVKPIPSLLGNLGKPTPPENKPTPSTGEGDVCSMRLISRPR